MSSDKKKREDTKAFNDKRNRMTTGLGAFLNQADDWATTESNSSQDDPGYERVISYKGLNSKLI